MFRGVFGLVALVAACGDSLPSESVDDAPPAPAPIVLEAPPYLRVVEGFDSALVVRLAAEPAHDVVVTARSADLATARVDPRTLVLTAATWSTGESFMVTGIEDDGDLINDVTDIELSVAGDIVHRVAATVMDNDLQQVVLDTSSIALAEAGSTTLTARLTREPAEPTTIRIWSTDERLAVPTPSTLTFGTMDYATPQSVTVAAPTDADTASGTARIYAGDLPGVDSPYATVTVTDDDVQALVLGNTSIAMNEGDTATFTVALAYDPLQPTTVTVATSDPTALAVLVAASLVFDSTNYAVPQTVTLIGTQDLDTANESVQVTLSGAPANSFTVPVIDDDQLMVPASLEVLEGQSSTLLVRLANDPGPSGRTVSVQVLSGDAAIAQPTLAFTSANYATGIPVTVDGLVDATSTQNKFAAIRVSAPGQVSRDVAVTVRQAIPGRFDVAMTSERTSAGFTGWNELSFRLANPLPADGQLLVTFPPTYYLLGVTLETAGIDGTMSFIASPTTAFVTRTGGSVLPAGTTVTLRIGHVRNPQVSGAYTVDVATYTASNSPLDSGSTTQMIQAGSLTNATVALSDLAADATGTATFTFTTTNPLPANGIVDLLFPLGFDASAATLIGTSGFDGNLTLSTPYVGTVRLTRSSGTTTPGGRTISIMIGGVHNPPTSQAVDMFMVVTKTTLGAPIDTGFPDGVTIGCPATITKIPQAATSQPSGGTPWLDPWEVTDALGSTHAFVNNAETSDLLVATDFRFSMPAGATVAGIQVEIDRNVVGFPAVDRSIRILKGASGQSEHATTAPWGHYETATYGSATDLWGESWSTADIESSSFGIALAVKALTPGMPTSVEVSSVRATVFLTCP